MEVSKEAYRFFIETMRRNGSTPGQIFDILSNAWKDESPSKATVYRVYQEMQSGVRTSFEDEKRSGRPKTACIPENADHVQELIKVKPHITIQELAEEVDISQGSVYTIVTVYLQLTSRCSRWVPHSLTDEQKLHRVTVAPEWLGVFQSFSDVDLLHRIVVIDEKYFYHRSLGTKESNRAWCLDSDERPRVPRRTMNDAKSHVICATSFCGRFHFLVLENASVNSEVYISFLSDMHAKFVHERNSLGWKDMILIQDNARPHISKKPTDFLRSKGVRVLKQPPYSPDYNLCDRWLFGTLERKRKKQNFASVHNLEEFLQEALQGLDKAAQERQWVHLKEGLTAIIDASGDYL